MAKEFTKLGFYQLISPWVYTHGYYSLATEYDLEPSPERTKYNRRGVNPRHNA